MVNANGRVVAGWAWTAGRCGTVAAMLLLLGIGRGAAGHQDVGQGEAADAEPVVDAAVAARALLDEHFAWVSREDPFFAASRGHIAETAGLPDVSPGAIERRTAELSARLARVVAIDTSGLSDSLQLDVELLRWMLEGDLAGVALREERAPVSSRGGPQIGLVQIPETTPMRTRADLEALVRWFEDMPRYLGQHEANMRAGMEAGHTPPRVTVAGAAEQALSQAEAMVARPRTSPLFDPFAALGPEDVLAARAAAVLEREVGPAFQRFGEFLAREYEPACRETIAAVDGFGGLGAYRLAVRRHATLELSPEEIHEIGLREVERIRGEMLAAIARTNGHGGHDEPARASEAESDGDARLARFIESLRRDPRFRATSSAELVSRYRDLCKRVDAELPRLFGRLPRTPYGVREMDGFQAPYAPSAYYYSGSPGEGLAGFFVVNTWRLDQRPTYEMVSLALHESVPGHHLQIMLAQERPLEGEQHPIRSLVSATGFTEGWALYAERLGLEMGEDTRYGLYADPYDDFGRLSFEAWRACRLVVDTGLHAFGWSRERAIEYMSRNTALSLTNIEREVDRYIGWPGQATGYTLGMMEILSLRSKAEAALGERFDIRRFHDAVLGDGTLPLAVLRQRMTRWIEAEAGATGG